VISAVGEISKVVVIVGVAAGRVGTGSEVAVGVSTTTGTKLASGVAVGVAVGVASGADMGSGSSARAGQARPVDDTRIETITNQRIQHVVCVFISHPFHLWRLPYAILNPTHERVN
jgi:hypothetical protein